MPKLTHGVPKYRLHKQSGQAIATFNGRDFLLGTHGTKASRKKYDRLLTLGFFFLAIAWPRSSRPRQRNRPS
jgi:hypothetical protein